MRLLVYLLAIGISFPIFANQQAYGFRFFLSECSAFFMKHVRVKSFTATRMRSFSSSTADYSWNKGAIPKTRAKPEKVHHIPDVKRTVKVQFDPLRSLYFYKREPQEVSPIARTVFRKTVHNKTLVLYSKDK